MSRYQCTNCGDYTCTARDWDHYQGQYMCLPCFRAALVHGYELTPAEIDKAVTERVSQ